METKRADGEKCERCWYYSTEIRPKMGDDLKHPAICPKCSKALA